MMTDSLDKPVKYLKGVGPQRSKMLSRLGITTVRDLIYYFPREHDDRRSFKKISEIVHGETVTVSGNVEVSGVKTLGPRLSVFKAAVSDKSGLVYACFFKKPDYRYDVFKKLKNDFLPGVKILLHGKAEKSGFENRIRVDEYEPLKDDSSDTLHAGRIVPVYPLTEGLNGRFFRQLVKTALDNFLPLVGDLLPREITCRLHIPAAGTAIKQFHFPDSFKSRDEARDRLALEEFILLETAMLLSKKQTGTASKKRKYEVTGKLLKPFRDGLGFEFTQSQKKVINEIFSDMRSSNTMNRLLIGDVGSGKTVVALSAALLAIENGHQAAFMAPTEILAEQHFYTVKHFLDKTGINFELLTGSVQPAGRKKILKNLSSGDVHLIIGTHALIEEGVKFKSLGLAIIDEQHRFGVLQRQKLRDKHGAGNSPDVLVMTATPIPRTLALTVYGDLDVSTINELPPNRKPVRTLRLPAEHAYEFIRNEVRKGRQAYIVFPLVEESDKMELKSVMGEINNLAENVFPGFKVGLLHGQMPGRRKEDAMLAFRDGRTEILASTTVIEIGIDVPNATVMAIEHSERFGLASLHQLRGRVGRAPDMDSYCLLMGEPQTEQGEKRIEVMLATNNGFEIGEMDLKLRGPGRFFGTEQHGLPELKIGDIGRDISLIAEARKYASMILEKGLLETEKPLWNALWDIYGKRLHFPLIG